MKDGREELEATKQNKVNNSTQSIRQTNAREETTNVTCIERMKTTGGRTGCLTFMGDMSACPDKVKKREASRGKDVR